MPPRKDLMRIIRADDTFSATLGFGTESPSTSAREFPVQRAPSPEATPAHASGHPDPTESDSNHVVKAAPETIAPSRGVVIYVAVSLTPAQAVRAESWAAAASCPVPLLMRRTAQGMRKELFDLWAVSGVERVEEQRGVRGIHPTSITLTLGPDLAAAFSAQLDPLGVIGLGRAIGPAFRLRFEAAFDAAAEKAGF